jgi:mannitol/fructose-specific phosphotransferase system IIA component (Ntr-type)
LGVAGGLLLQWVVRRNYVEEDMLNIVAFGAAMAIFGLAEAVLAETGLLSVTAAGFVFGLSGTARLKKVREFKAEITDLLIGTLFILLAARLEPQQFVDDFGMRGVATVAVIMLVIRPLSVFLCSWGVDLSLRQKLFLSWIAPRGIVAASLASLVAIRLGEMDNVTQPRFVETLTYSVIIATIVIQGMTARPLSRLLRIARREPDGWLIVGAHALGRGIAKFLTRDVGLHVVLVDSNDRRVREAGGEGLVALCRDARDVSMASLPLFQNIGNVLALTDNEDLNDRVCRHWSEICGRDRVHRYDPAATAAAVEDAEAPGTGHIVWPGLARPSLLSGELDREEARLVVATSEDDSVVSDAWPLIVSSDQGVSLAPDNDRPTMFAPDNARGLFLSRRTDYLRRCLRPELFVTVKANTLEGMFAELLEPALQVVPRLPRDTVLRELVDREQRFPTALGHGIATPHTYHDAMQERLCVVGRVPDGIDYGARDGEPVTLVFLLLSPPGDPDGHLATLAELSHLMINPATRERAKVAISGAEIVELVRSG